MKLMQKHTSLGYRVLLVGRSSTPIVNGKFNGVVEPIAFIVLQDHIKESAIDTFKWFKANNVAVKVISGDNALTVSEIARQAGVEGAEKCVSLEGMPLEQVALIAKEFNVFGRVSPEQKEVIIQTLKSEGHKVAMTGDGVNDILALKRADCSIAMASGSDAARNVSHIVLLDNDFNHLPDVVAEGRRVINNIQRTSSLFLTKTVFAMFFTTLFLIFSLIFSVNNYAGDKNPMVYPFSPNNFYVWELLAIGFASFFLTLEPNKEIVRGKFFSNIFRKLIPAAIAIITPVLIIYVMFLLGRVGQIYSGIKPDVVDISGIKSFNSEAAKSMATIAFSCMSVAVLYKTSTPLSKYRRIIFLITLGLVVLVLGGSAVYSIITGNDNLLLINFNALTTQNIIQTVFITVISIATYLVVTYIIEVFKGEHDNEN
jgi:cation-transporting ATPase E